MSSFKKIALAMVAAMTMGLLTVAPANAAVATALTVGGNPAVGGTTAAAPVELNVPADNSVDLADALRIAITGLDTGTVVSATATNGKIVTSLASTVLASGGSATASVNTGTGNSADFYVFTTSVNSGSVAVTIGANTTTYFFKGLAGALNSIALEAPATAAAGTAADVKVSGFDVFGNPKGGAAIALQVITANASTSSNLTTDTASATVGTKATTVTMPASGKVTLVATATVANAVTGLTAPKGVVVLDVTVRDLAAELAAEKAARVADKIAADKALADANAEIAKLKADKAAADKALADATAAHAKTIADLKASVNKLIAKANKSLPKSKRIPLVK